MPLLPLTRTFALTAREYIRHFVPSDVAAALKSILQEAIVMRALTRCPFLKDALTLLQRHQVP